MVTELDNRFHEFYETEGLLLYAQELTSGYYHKTIDSHPNPYFAFLRYVLILGMFAYVRLRLCCTDFSVKY